MRSIGGTVFMSKKTGFQGSAKHKTLNTPSLMGPKKTNGAIKLTNGQFGGFRILDEKKKYDDIMNKYIKKDNEMPINRNEIFPEQKLDLKKFSTAQTLNNNQLKNISTDKVNNPQKSPNMHYSIESKDKKNPKFKDTKRTQIIASQQKANNPVSDLNLGNKQKSEFSLQYKTKPLKQRGSTAHQIKKKPIIIDGSIQTPSKKQNPLEKSEVLNSSQKKNIIEFNISESQNDYVQTKKMNQTDSHFIKHDDNTKYKLRARPGDSQLKNDNLINTHEDFNKKMEEKIQELISKKENDDSKKESNEKPNDINYYIKKLSDTKKIINEKIKKNNILIKQINDLNNNIKEKTEKIIKLKKEHENEINNKNRQINQLLEELNKLRESKNNNEENIIEELKEQLLYKERTITEKDRTINELNTKLKETLEKIKQIEDKKEKINSRDMLNIQEKQKELDKKEKDLSILKTNLLDAQKKIKEFERRLNEKVKFIEQTEYALQSEQDRFNRDKKQYSNNINEIQNEIKNLNIKKLELENTIKMQMEQINNFNQRNMNINSNNNNNNLMNMNMNMNMPNSANNNMNFNNLMNNMGNFMNNNNMMMNPINYSMFNINNNNINNNINNNNNNFPMSNSNFNIEENNFNQFKIYNSNFNQNNFNKNFNNNNNDDQLNPNRQITKKVIKKTLPLDFYKKPTLIGLQNIGATCFMNSTLQCLSQTVDLTNYFLDERRSLNKIINNNIAMKKNNELQLSPVYLELVKNLWDKNNEGKYYKPKKFMETIEAMNPLFKLGEAGDSKDFIIFLLEQFHTELKINKNNISLDNNPFTNQYNQKTAFKNFIDEFKKQTSIISDIFYGIQESNTTCLNCKNIHSRRGQSPPICYNYQIFNCLIFPLEEVRKYRFNNNNRINTVTLEDCFNYNQKLDYFTGDNKNYCNICKQTWDSNYITKIYSAPSTLILILNRGKNNCYDVKLNFTETIDITDFVTMKSSKLIYNLYGVITHYGESGPSAHFLAFCKSPINNKWYRYNDAMVTIVNNLQKDVIEFGNPYILFYKQQPQQQQ